MINKERKIKIAENIDVKLYKKENCKVIDTHHRWEVAEEVQTSKSRVKWLVGS